jgi:hypothetical protein
MLLIMASKYGPANRANIKKGEREMRKLEIYKDDCPIAHEDGTVTWETRWVCSDGISCYYGDTKAEAMAHYGVPVGVDD